MTRILAILLLVLLPFLAVSQHYATKTFTIDDGLPSNKVNCLYQDSIGRLWVGTDAGIVIYDGLDFRIIIRKDGLASNDVRAITADDKGNLWFACYSGGVTKYDGRHFINFTTNDGLVSNLVRRLYYSENYKTLFVGADDGFYTFMDDKFIFYGKKNGKMDEQHEILWFLEGNGFIYVFPFKDFVHKFYPATNKIIKQIEPVSDENKMQGVTSALVKKNGDTVWGNRFSISTKTGIRSFQSPKSGLVFSSCEDDEENIWLPVFGSVVSGILKMNLTGIEDYSEQLRLNNIKLNFVLFDQHQNVLWLASENDGLISFPKPLFSYYPMPTLNGKSGTFRQLYYYKGNRLLVSKDHIFVYSPNGEIKIISTQILGYNIYGNQYQKIINEYGKNIAGRKSELWRLPEFYWLAKDDHQNLWVSTTIGFYRFNDDLTKVDKVLPFDTRYGIIEFNSTGDLFNWGYWLYTLDIVPQPDKQIKPVEIWKYSNVKSQLPIEGTKMLPVGQNMLFSSLYGGLYLFDGKTFSHLNKSNPELPENISDVCLGNDGNIIYCTNTGELGIGVLSNGRFNIHYKVDTLDNSFGRNFLWLQCDMQNNIYMGTNRGLLVLYNPDIHSSQARDIRFFSKSEGYYDFSVSTPILDDEGSIWLVSQNTLLKLDTKAISERKPTGPKLVLTKVESSDSTYDFTNILGTQKSWTFSHHSNNLTFHFTNINLLNPEKDFFYVQLEGFGKSFKPVGNDRKIEYTNLPAGNYKFVVRVFNTNTLSRQSKTLLEFRIKPPYWQTWWFFTAMAILIIVLVTGIFKFRTNQIRKEAQTKLDIAELEMQALQSQMNPHFFFNVMNSLQRYILERDTDKGIGLLEKINTMVRQTFAIASKKAISLKEEVTYLDSYLKLEQVRSGNKFQYEISVDPALNQNGPLIPPMLIQPMVENAVKHGLMPLDGNDGLLQISFSRKGEKALTCTITDNGIGIQSSLDSKRDASTRLSKAMNITQRRIELLKRSNKAADYSIAIVDQSKDIPSGNGTKVIICLPLN